jgi:CCR4-NOT transcription complex subunit 1
LSNFQLLSYALHLPEISSETFQSLQPVFFPGFVFSWMALISHRLFLPKVLITPNGEVRRLFVPLTAWLILF